MQNENKIEKARLVAILGAFFIEPESVTALHKTLHALGIGILPSIVNIKDDFAKLGLMLSGGAITSLFTDAAVNDLDFYIKDKENIPEAVAFFTKWFPEVPYVTENAYTFKRKSSRSRKMWTVQLITRFTGTPTEILDTFDFTVTQGLYDFANEVFVFGDRFFQDNSKRKLVYLGKSHFPICAMYRTKKYQDKGYKLPGSTIMHIALSIVRLNIMNYRDLKQQLMGIDTIYLQGLLNSGKYDDALPVDYGTFLVDAFEHLDGISHTQEEFQTVWQDAISPVQG